MKISRVLAAGVCLVTLGAAVVWAADPPKPSKPMNLQDCIDTAMRNQVDVQAARNQVTSAKAQVVSAVSGYFPQISLTAGRTSDGANYDLANASTGYASGAALVLNLLDGGARAIRVRQARAGKDIALNGVQRTMQNVTFTITKSYFDLLRNQHLLSVAEQQVSFAEGQRDLIKGRIDAGDAAASDIYPVEAQLANAKVAQLSARNQVRVSLTELQRGMGVAPSADFAIVEITDPPKKTIPDQEACVREALKSRPDLDQAAASVTSSKASVKMAQLQITPQFLVNGRMNQQIGLSGSPRTWTFYTGLSMNVFDGGAAMAQLRDARAGLSTTVARREQLSKDVAAEVQEAYLNLTSAQERIDASEMSVTAAQKNFEAQQERYKQQLAIPLDLVNAQVALATAQSNAVQALYDYYTSQAQLDLAMGK